MPELGKFVPVVAPPWQDHLKLVIVLGLGAQFSNGAALGPHFGTVPKWDEFARYQHWERKKPQCWNWDSAETGLTHISYQQYNDKVPTANHNNRLIFVKLSLLHIMCDYNIMNLG